MAEKYTDLSRDLYVCYVDFGKAFDSIWREGLWKVMRSLGYPDKIVRILESHGTFSAVRADTTNWFDCCKDVLCHHCCSMFNIFLEPGGHKETMDQQPEGRL
jgi:hypothetical protein